ncbi:putative gustatory receptor [Trypoxylus dichotomus]
MSNKIGVLDAKREEPVHFFYASLKPMFNIARLIGAIPVTFDFRDEKPTSPNDLCFTLIHTLFYTVFTAYTIYAILANENYHYIVSKDAVTSNLDNLCRKAIRSIDRTDRSTANLMGIDRRVAPNRSFKVYGILTFMFMSIVFRTTLIIVTVPIDFLEQLTVFFATFMKTFSKYQFGIIVLAISERFERVNDNIRDSFRRRPPKAFAYDLHILTRYHYRLCDACRMMNIVFGVQLLYSVFVSLVDILFHSYCLYVGLMKKRYFFTGWTIVRGVIWIIDEFIEMYFLVYACVKTCTFANMTVVIVHELRTSIMRCIEIEKQIQMYSVQFLHQRLKFSALGFFAVEYSLLYSIASAVATYLVIVIQLDEGRTSCLSINTTSTTNLVQ